MRKGLIIVLGIAFVLSLTGVVSAADPLAEDMFDTSHIFPGDGGKEIDDDYVSAYVPVTFDISSEQYTVTIPSVFRRFAQKIRCRKNPTDRYTFWPRDSKPKCSPA